MDDGHTPREVTLRGIVVPTEWSSRGEVLRVAILTPDEEQYDVSQDGAGPDLLQALREEVDALVRIDDGRGEERRVTVLSFAVVDTYDAGDNILGDLLKRSRNHREGAL